MTLLIGIDDTDNKDSRGTGFHSRQLATLIENQGLGKVNGITRHQLFVHEAIAYTSQNSSACLDVSTANEKELTEFCATYLINESAEGSDAGLCIAHSRNVSETILEWGKRAKEEVLHLDEALRVAESAKVYLQGFTGTYIGQIGALAAVGLRKSGNDGRFIWLKEIRELRDFDAGIYSVNELILEAGIDQIQSLDGKTLRGTDKILCHEWIRPVLINNCAVLLAEKINFADYGWKTIAKDYIRTIT